MKWKRRSNMKRALGYRVHLGVVGRESLSND